MSNTDRLSPPRRVHSIRRHAAYVCQVRRDNGGTHARKCSPSNVTEAALRKSIIEILSHSQQEADLAANELAETMDSVFFTKAAGSGDVSRPELAHPPALIHSDNLSLHTGYPAQCVTVVTHERERSPSNHATPTRTRARRNPLLVMEKLSKQRPQKSVPDMAPRKASTSDESTLSHRSRGLASKLSRAVLRSRKPSTSTSTTSSEKRDSRPPSRLSGTLSTFGSSLKQSFSLTRTADVSTTANSTPMLDCEKASYEQIVYQKHDGGVAYPLVDSPMALVEQGQDFAGFRDSAYYSKASDASEDGLAAGVRGSDASPAHASYSTPRRPHTSKGASLSSLSPALTPPVLRTPDTDTPPIPARNAARLPASPHYYLTPPPPLRRPALHHSSSLPTLTLNTIVPTASTPVSARRPRFDRFLSTASMLSDAASASSSYSHSPTTSKPPSPLRERPFLDLKKGGGHRRVLSSGSRTESIRIYLDEEDEVDEGERDEDGEEVEENQRGDVQWAEVQWTKPLDTGAAAQRAMEELKAALAATGTCTLSSPLVRQALAVDDADTSSATTMVDDDTQEPFTLAPLTFKHKPTPITQHRNYPDVPYAPHPSPPVKKRYNIYPHQHSRQPLWEGPWTRRCPFDHASAELFRANNFTQADIAKRVVKGRVGRADGASSGPASPLEAAVCRGEAFRGEGERVGNSVEEYLEKARNDAAEGGGIGLAL